MRPVAPNAETAAADRRVIDALGPVLDAVKAERRTRRRAVRALAVAVALSVAAGGGVLRNTQRIEREAVRNAERVERESVARNVALCEEGNRFRGDVGGVLNQLLDLGAVADRDLPAEQQRAATERRAKSRELGAKAFAPKDCAAISRTKPEETP